MIRKAIFPGCYRQGDGILKDLSIIDELKGKNLFILAANSAIDKIIIKHIDHWNTFSRVTYDKFNGHSTWDEINRVIGLAEDCEYIAGMGGGKCLDTARVAAKKLGKPFISIPTIAATDAPTASACVIHDEHGVMVDYFTTKNPDYVIVDSRVIAEAPTRFLVSGMGDALSTWFEAYTCKTSAVKNIAGEYNTLAVMSIAELCYKTLIEYGVAAKISCDSHLVTPALEHVIEANILLSGLGFESGGLSACHGIHNIFLHTPAAKTHYHGEIVGFSTLASLFIEDKHMTLIDEVYGFCESVGLPTTLSDLGLQGIANEALLAAINKELSDPIALIQKMPHKPSAQEVLDAIRMADAFGKNRSTLRQGLSPCI